MWLRHCAGLSRFCFWVSVVCGDLLALGLVYFIYFVGEVVSWVL